VPGTLSEVDHVDGWALGNGTTDIDRLTLCCGWHNRWRHTNPHQIDIGNDKDGRFVYRLLPPPDRYGGFKAPPSWTQQNDRDRPAAHIPAQRPSPATPAGRTHHRHPSTRTHRPEMAAPPRERQDSGDTQIPSRRRPA
jgi:hypothetical protein